MEKREPSDTVDGNLNWSHHYREQYRSSLKTLKVELPYDPTISLMGVYPQKPIIQEDACIPVRFSALSVVARTWKQRKCPSTDEWISGVYIQCNIVAVVGVQSPSRVWFFMTPWTAASQDSLSFAISQSLPKFMSIESVMSSKHLTLCCPLSFCLQSSPVSGSFLTC